MQYNLPMPPTLMGTEAEQLVQIHRYLFRMNDMLNQAISAENVTLQDVAKQQSKSVSVEQLDDELTGQYNRAKALIIKTADEVRTEMDRVEAVLRSQYVAKSEWGEYREDVSQEITATATDIVQSFNYQGQIDALGTDFDNYKIQTSGYIQSGIIGTDDDGVPIIGIAIGRDLRSEVIDGQVYIDMTKSLATYTSDRITFWQNGAEAAHISNSEMVITNVSISGTLSMGSRWEIGHTKGFTIKWIGGDE